MKHTVAEAGFYNGTFLKAGETYHDDDLESLTVEQLVAYAGENEIEIDPGESKAWLINAIRAAESEPRA